MQGLLSRIDALVEETFGLWDERRVGFSWERYYMNHTRRVRDLCLAMGSQVGADLDLLSIAATMHDVTKRYDGEIIKDEEGNRILDERGFWRNEVLKPVRVNRVTKLYDKLHLEGQMHNETGAIVAVSILCEMGLPGSFAAEVGEVIRAHVQPWNNGAERAEDSSGSRIECSILHDADMIDANLGLVAFYRHSHILIHRMWEATGVADIREYAPRVADWVEMKVSFVDRMRCDVGRERAMERLARSQEMRKELDDEMAHWEAGLNAGVLGIINHFIQSHDDPDLNRQLEELKRDWLPSRAEAAGKGVELRFREKALQFVDLLEQEIKGEA